MSHVLILLFLECSTRVLHLVVESDVFTGESRVQTAPSQFTHDLLRLTIRTRPIALPVSYYFEPITSKP